MNSKREIVIIDDRTSSFIFIDQIQSVSMCSEELQDSGWFSIIDLLRDPEPIYSTLTPQEILRRINR